MKKGLLFSHGCFSVLFFLLFASKAAISHKDGKNSAVLDKAYNKPYRQGVGYVAKR